MSSNKLVTKVKKMGSIPENWSVVEIQNICNTSSGGTPSRTNLNYYKGNIPWIKTGELKDGFIYETEEHISEEALKASSAKLFPPNTLLFAMYGATIGKTGITKIPATTNQACCAFLPLNKQTIDPYYLQQYFILVRPRIISKGEGAGQPNTSQDFLKSFRILYPPFKEQQKIASILSKVNEVIQKSDQTIQQTRQLKKGLMQKLLTKGIGHDRFKKTKIGSIPTDWECVLLHEIVDVKGRVGWKGYTNADLVSEKEGAISLGVNNIDKNNKLTLHEVTYVSWSKYYESPEIQVNRGDIIVAQRGATIGKVAIVDKEIGKATINPNVILIKNAKIDNFFLYSFFDSVLFRKQISVSVSSTSIPLLTQQQLKSFMVPIPPINEQNKISQAHNYIDKLLEVEVKRSLLLRKQIKGLMQQLLTGKIRVKIQNHG